MEGKQRIEEEEEEEWAEREKKMRRESWKARREDIGYGLILS